MIEYLDLGDIQYLIVRALGQPPESIVRDWGLLESAMYRPQSVVFGTDAYPTLDEKAAALLHSLSRNHPLLDGNKRLAWLAVRLFYARNGRDLRAPDAQAGDALVRAVAMGEYDIGPLTVLLGRWIVDLAG